MRYFRAKPKIAEICDDEEEKGNKSSPAHVRELAQEFAQSMEIAFPNIRTFADWLWRLCDSRNVPDISRWFRDGIPDCSEFMVSNFEQASHAAEAAADIRTGSLRILVFKVVFYFGPGMLENRADLNLNFADLIPCAQADAFGIHGKVHNQMQGSIAEFIGGEFFALVHGVFLINGEITTQQRSDFVDFIFIIGDDAEAAKIGNICELFVFVFVPGNLAAQALAVFGTTADGMDMQRFLPQKQGEHRLELRCDSFIKSNAAAVLCH